VLGQRLALKQILSGAFMADFELIVVRRDLVRRGSRGVPETTFVSLIFDTRA
jgi:hypothetical protein